MSQLLTISLTRIFISVIAVVVLVIFSTTSVFSQTASPAGTGEQSTAISLTFPIPDLGECKNLEECTNYCEDPVNYNSCSSFAKKNGFYRDDKTTYASDEDWKDTQGELGCNSKDSCF